MTMLYRVFVLALCLVLAACASQPNGSHSFTVAPKADAAGVWKLDGLAGSGRIDLTMRLRGDGADAAFASLKFNYRDERIWDHDLVFDDRACRGAYNVSFTHKHGQERLSDYLKTRLPWEETARLRLEWRSDGRFAVTVNGREQKIVQSVTGIGNLAIEVRSGEMVVDDLTYTQLTSDTPLLPSEHKD